MFFASLLTFGVQAKTLEQKKTELKNIYEAGGISKVEYDKAFEFLEEPEKKEKKTKKQFFSRFKVIILSTHVQVMSKFGTIN